MSSSRFDAHPERRLMWWMALPFATNVVCALMLAGRAASPPGARGFFDVAIFALLAGVCSFAIVRFMFLYPFRLLDLLVIVVVLSLGMKSAIDLVDALQQSAWAPRLGLSPGAASGEKLDRNVTYVLYSQACIVMTCVLMAGAAMGLRHCRLLEVESQAKRAFVLVCGMAAIPALFGIVAIPIYLLNELLSEKQTSPQALGWIMAFGFSIVCEAANTLFALKSIALKAEIATNETKG